MRLGTSSINYRQFILSCTSWRNILKEQEKKFKTASESYFKTIATCNDTHLRGDLINNSGKAWGSQGAVISNRLRRGRKGGWETERGGESFVATRV